MSARPRLFRSLFSYVILGYTICVAGVIGIYTWLLYTELENGRRAPFDIQLDAQAQAYALQLRHDDADLDLTYFPVQTLSNMCCAVYTTNSNLLLVGPQWHDVIWHKSWLTNSAQWRGTLYNQRGERMRYTVRRVGIRPTKQRTEDGEKTRMMPAYIVNAGLYEPVYEYLLAQKSRLTIAVILLTFTIGIFALITARMSLRPLRRLVSRVKRCDPDSPGASIESDDLPRELIHLASAINAAFARQQSALHAERAFTAAAAHELRSPVASLASQLQMLRESPALPPALAEECDQLIASAARLKNLSGRLLLLSRLDRAAHGEHFAKEDVDLNEVTEDAIAACADSAAQNNITLHHQPAAGAVIIGHEEWILRAVYNVISNAVKYTYENTSIDVTVETAADGSRCAVSIVDEGPGIALSERIHVTEKFYRGKDVGKKDGTGLGLALVADVMRAHKGELTLNEGPGKKGLRVTLIFPGK